MGHRTSLTLQTVPLLMFCGADSDGVSAIGTALEQLVATMDQSRACEVSLHRCLLEVGKL